MWHARNASIWATEKKDYMFDASLSYTVRKRKKKERKEKK